MPFTTTTESPAQPLLYTLDVLSRRLVDLLSPGVAGDRATDQMFEVRDRMDAILNGGTPPAGGPWSATEAPLTKTLLDALAAERAAAVEACGLVQGALARRARSTVSARSRRPIQRVSYRAGAAVHGRVLLGRGARPPRFHRVRPLHSSKYYPVILKSMKTAISVPDRTFERATQRAHELGMSRSEFFATAAERYLDELDSGSLTEQIDTALARLDSTDDSADAAVGVGRRVLADDEW